MKTFAVAAVLLALSLPALAAPPPGHRPGAMMGEERPATGMMRGMCGMGLGQRTEGSLAYLKAELKITSSQEAAWQAFAVSYRNAKGHGGDMPMMGPMGGDKGARPIPERMTQHIKMMEDHLAEMKKTQSAVATLYAALDANQKRTADEILPMFLMCRMM
ncbi:MAG: Spy/CpxP family protein refolding chaperone [Alphaproteobacteria bacterium]|nr:Spy/CpxP family protein refolding chaperone [Alphaproteobacteria bacterium]